jgi:hypothetical protein
LKDEQGKERNMGRKVVIDEECCMLNASSERNE